MLYFYLILHLQQGMGLLHCATQGNHLHVMNFIFESLENVDINSTEKVGSVSFVFFCVYPESLKKVL